MRKARIICTIGPASSRRDTIFSLIENGMDVARLNFSHGDHESHGKVIDLIRKGSAIFERPVAILQDLQGIKIRVGLMKAGSVYLKEGRELFISAGDGEGDEKRIFISYPQIGRDAKAGDAILLDDGAIRLEVIEKGRRGLKTKVLEGGILRDRKGVNLPFRIASSAFTSKDVTDLTFGLKRGVDYVALSYVRNAVDIKKVKAWLKAKGKTIPLIAKIEKPEAVAHIDEILDEADGIMIARGDLGVETSPEKVPVIQKRLIELSNRKGKIVITATQMLESMREHSRPTRAEAADVANAVLDGSDALMLSGETASGKYPLEALGMMDKIITYTERQYPAALSSFKVQESGAAGFSEAVADAACRAAEDIKAKYIIAFTQSGFTAKLVSKFRPRPPVIAFIPGEDVRRKTAIHWGVISRFLRPLSSTDEMISEVEKALLKERLARKGDRIVITASTPILGAGKTNLLKLHTIGEENRR